MTSQRHVKVIGEGYSYLEGPRWRKGRLWVSDFYTGRVLAIAPDGRAETIVTLEDQPSGLGWLPDGRLLIISMRTRRVLRLDPGGLLAVHADLAELASWHLNDMVVDAHGRAYVGNFGFDLMGRADPQLCDLVRVDPDGSTVVACRDMYFPNGAVISSDGHTMIVAESFAQRLTAFDIEHDGSLTNRRVWAKLGDVPTASDFEGALAQVDTAPDGICLDEEGCIWFADGFGRRVVRVREGGEIVEEIATEDSTFACMLGGDDGRTLFMCSAPSFDETQASATHAARLLACRVDVAHAGLP